MDIPYVSPDYKDIALGLGASGAFTFAVKNNLGSAVNVSGKTFVLKIDSERVPSSLDTKITELGGTILDATGGIVQFRLQTNDEIEDGLYYYTLEAQERTSPLQSLNKNLILSGLVNLATGSRGFSGLDWKADAVSGQLGQVFNQSNTSGVAFFAGGTVYKDETSGISLIFSHAEEGYWTYSDPTDTTKPGGFLGSIRLKVSFDDGLTLYDAGKILTSHVSSNPSGIAVPVDGGHPQGQPGYIPITDSIKNVALCVKRGDYLYAYYGTDRISSRTNDAKEYSNLCVARALYSDVIESAANKSVCNWYKYYDGSFSQPGLAGSATPLINSWNPIFPGQNFTNMAGFYSELLQQTVILFNLPNLRILDAGLPIFYIVSNPEDIFAIFSQDGINFSFPQKITTDYGARHFGVVGNRTHLGLINDSVMLYMNQGPWGNYKSLSLGAMSISAIEPREYFRTFSVESYSQLFKLNQTIDRGQLHPIIATMHYIKEQAKLLEASAYYYNNTSGYVVDNRWKNVLQSYANNSTELSGNFPDSFDDYINFEFGRDMHKLYYEYTHNFARHRTTPTILNFDGPLITAHTYGSIIYNSDFEAQGSAALTYSNLITSSLDSVNSLNAGRGIFSSSGTASGTYLASSILNYGSSIGEFRNSAILSHVELCQTSGASTDNEFTIIDIFGKTKAATRRNKLLGDNVLIRQKAVDGFGRIIFDISKYPLPAAYFDKQYNFLSPEHEFEVSLKALIGDADGIHLGGGAVGIWIHTKPEGGKVWTYAKDKLWVQHEAEGITKDDVIGKYSHNFFLPLVDRQLNSPTFVSASNRFVCARALDPTNPNRINDLISTYQENEFTDIKIKFNTMNRACNRDVINVPKDYFEQVSSRVHRLNQNYVIELFTLPQQNDKFTLFYGLNMVDLTLNKLSKPIAAKTGCEYLRVDLPPQHLLNIIKYFNLLAGDYDNTYVNNLTGYASRVSTITSSFMEASGGSRITYVEDPNWGANSPNTHTLRDQITIIN